MSGVRIVPGLVSISFRDRSPEQIVERARACGLSAIEWGSDVHAPADRPDRVAGIADLTRRAGLVCCSYGTYLRAGQCAEAELRLHIAAARRLGTNVLRLWAGDRDYEAYTPEETERFFAECRALARIAEEENVVLCMECHNHTFTSRLAGALSLIEAVRSDAFRMYWQPNQLRTAEENLEYARRVAPYTRHIHVFNWEGAERYPLAGAKTLWKAYLSKFPGAHCALLEFMPDDDLNTLGRESETLIKWTKEL